MNRITTESSSSLAELQAALAMATQHSGQLFWIRQDVPIESLLPRRKGADTDGANKPWARADNFKSTQGYGYQTSPDGIALFYVNGLIAPAAYADPWDDSCTISDLLAQDVMAATADPDVRGGMFVINSPGGYVAGSYELAEAIAAMTAAKPTASFVTSLAASAAYLQAAMTGSITAFKTSATGSIGTRSVLYDASGMFGSLGLRVIPIDSGGMKSAGLFGTAITDEQKAYFQSLIDKSNAFFVDAVATGRGFTADRAKSLADGKVHLAADAKSLGLIDAVGSLDEAMASLRTAQPGPKRQQRSTHQNRNLNSTSTFLENDMSSNARPATIAELKAAFKSDPTFALDAAERALTLTEAKAEYSDKLEVENASLREQIAAAPARRSGTDPLTSGGGGGRNQKNDPRQDAADASQEFADLIDQEAEKLEKRGTKNKEVARMQAYSRVSQRRPDLKKAIILAANPRLTESDL